MSSFKLKMQRVLTPDMLRPIEDISQIRNTINILVPGVHVRIINEQLDCYLKQCSVETVNDNGTYTVSCIEEDGKTSTHEVHKTDIEGTDETLVSVVDYSLILGNATTQLNSILRSEQDSANLSISETPERLGSDVCMTSSSSSSSSSTREHRRTLLNHKEMQNIVNKITNPNVLKLRQSSEKIGACCYAVQKIHLIIDAFLNMQIEENPYLILLQKMSKDKVRGEDLANVEQMCKLLTDMMSLFTYGSNIVSQSPWLTGYDVSEPINEEFYIMRVLCLHYLFPRESSSFNIFEDKKYETRDKLQEIQHFLTNLKTSFFTASENEALHRAQGLLSNPRPHPPLNSSEQTQLLLDLLEINFNFAYSLFNHVSKDNFNEMYDKLKILKYLGISCDVSKGAISGENKNPIDSALSRNELYQEILCGRPCAMILLPKVNLFIDRQRTDLVYIDHWFTIDIAGHVWVHLENGYSYKINIYKFKGAWGGGNKFCIKYATVYLNSMELHQLFTSMMESVQNSFVSASLNAEDIFQRAFLDKTKTMTIIRTNQRTMEKNIDAYISSNPINEMTMREVNLNSDMMSEIIKIMMDLKLIWNPSENYRKGGTKKNKRKMRKITKKKKETRENKKYKEYKKRKKTRKYCE